MAKNFSVLQKKMPLAAQRRAQRLAKKYRAEMALDELREARAMTQQHLAKILGVNQAAVSKMEHRADMYISTLQDFVRAMGGRLVISAIFPEGEVKITQFQSLANGNEASRKEMAAAR
jgi:transcriptional regulator with XRE-family HTH domain